MTDLLMNQVTDLEPPVLFDYLTDFPSAHCPRCDREPSQPRPITIHGITGFQCPDCRSTYTGPYLRGEKDYPDGQQSRSYADRPGWTSAENRLGQIRIRCRPAAGC